MGDRMSGQLLGLGVVERPRYALPMGVRAVDTMTASLTVRLLSWVERIECG